MYLKFIQWKSAFLKPIIYSQIILFSMYLEFSRGHVMDGTKLTSWLLCFFFFFFFGEEAIP